MVARVNPPPLKVPRALLDDPEVAGFYNDLLTVIRQLWAKTGASVLLDDGTVDAPALGFANEVGLGFYRPDVGAVGIASGGVSIVEFSPDGLHVENLQPSSFIFNDAAGNLDSVTGTNGQFLIGVNGSDPLLGTIAGTLNRLSVTYSPTGFDVDISTGYAGQNTITTLGAISAGTWNGTAVGAAYGGTGQASYTLGDILYASGTAALSKLTLGAANRVLGVNNAGTAPEYKSINGTANQVIVTHGANTITLSTPQDIATTSNVTFGTVTSTGAFGCNGKTAQTAATVNAAVGGAAGVAYTATEQTMINDLKALANQLRTALVNDGIAV